jgi:hypothetical protein
MQTSLRKSNSKINPYFNRKTIYYSVPSNRKELFSSVLKICKISNIAASTIGTPQNNKIKQVSMESHLLNY